ncbi:hypothetical protein [Paenibacillus lentus]|uniref:hypothetical protein n=1 Tax=Paenibacillus lentus TaxID=1338368 RepID=UPI0036D20B5B
MIGPLFLRGELIEKFRNHLLSVPYYHIIHKGSSQIDNPIMNLSEDQIDSIIHNFVNSNFPIVCSAGSKSSIPFFDYHIALKYSNDMREVEISELLVFEPKDRNAINGIEMAFYVLVNKKVGVERIQIPFILKGLDDRKDIFIEFDFHRNITYLSKRTEL